jgi:beta-alanine degradation protein BauB
MQRTAHFVVLFGSLLCACGGTAEPSTSSGAGGEQPTAAASPEDSLPAPAPIPTVELSAGQASASPSVDAVALAAVTSQRELSQRVKDPVKVSPGNYKIVLQSTRMRLLVATWEPGESDELHGHPPIVVYALTDVDGLSTGETGKQKPVKLRAGASFFQNPEKAHSFKNVGSQSASMLLLELLQRVDPMPMPENAAPDALVASPEVYKRVFEDEHVRVLLATWAPGQKDDVHSHPELAAYALTPIHSKVHEDKGSPHELVREAGSGVFQDPVKSHRHENIAKATAQLVLFEPKGGAARAAAADPSSFAKLPVESGDGSVTTWVEPQTGVKMDIGGGFTLEIPPGVEFGNVVTLGTSSKKLKAADVTPGFVPHAQTLELDADEESLAKQIVLGMTATKLPVKSGHRFVLAMEKSGPCTAKNKRRLASGGCAYWDFIPTLFDETRGKVIAKLGATGGYRLQFGWVAE